MTKQELLRLAWLARLDFTDEEMEELSSDMAELLSFVQEIAEESAPVFFETTATVGTEALRPDEPSLSETSETVTGERGTEDGYFSVQR
ncbi:MAG: hypothetical protein ACI4U2_02910, partial [Christensenellaceae bacterium]